MTQSLQLDSQQEVGQHGRLPTCEFLEQELSAVHAARAAERLAKGSADGASAAGLTCELLEAEIRSLTSQPPSPSHRHHGASRAGMEDSMSPRKHFAATRIQ